MKPQITLSLYGIITNFFLFIGKLVVALLSGSIALFSDAFNSLVDVMSSIVSFFAIKVSRKKADEGHPLGHHQAEPIAGLLIAIFAFTLAIDIFQGIVTSFLAGYTAHITFLVFAILLLTIIVKIIMSYIFLKKAREFQSPVLKANGIDSRNDVFVSLLALIGVYFTYIGYAFIEVIFAIAISLIILYTAFLLAKENISYLMGSSLSKAYIERVKKRILAVHGVKGHGKVIAFYTGSYINIESEIIVDKNLLLKDAHQIREHVRKRLIDLPYVNHVDVYLGIGF